MDLSCLLLWDSHCIKAVLCLWKLRPYNLTSYHLDSDVLLWYVQQLELSFVLNLYCPNSTQTKCVWWTLYSFTDSSFIAAAASASSILPALSNLLTTVSFKLRLLDEVTCISHLKLLKLACVASLSEIQQLFWSHCSTPPISWHCNWLLLQSVCMGSRFCRCLAAQLELIVIPIFQKKEQEIFAGETHSLYISYFSSFQFSPKTAGHSNPPPIIRNFLAVFSCLWDLVPMVPCSSSLTNFARSLTPKLQQLFS